MRKLILAGLIAFITFFPLTVFAQNEQTAVEPDPYHVPRMGIELGTWFGGGWWWDNKHEAGLFAAPSLGFGILEDRGGALFRLGGTTSNNERILNWEALLWLPRNVNSRGDVYLALGPAIQ